MNCEEYREAITADPAESFTGGSVHSAGCDACAAYRDELRALDARIAAALTIDVPTLETPVLSPDGRNVTRLPSRRSGRAGLPAWLGIAAGLAIAGVFAMRFFSPDFAPPTLAEQVIAHMDHEQESRQVTSVPVSSVALHGVLDPEVSAMNENLGLVTYARSCVIDGHTVPHLVIQGAHGPVTLILLPDEQIDEAIPLSGKNVHGVIVPVGSGSVAIIGERTEQLGEIDEIGHRIVDSVKWRT